MLRIPKTSDHEKPSKSAADNYARCGMELDVNALQDPRRLSKTSNGPQDEVKSELCNRFCLAVDWLTDGLTNWRTDLDRVKGWMGGGVLDRQFVDSKTAWNGTQRDWTGTAGLLHCNLWQLGRPTSPDRGNDRRSTHTHTNKKRMQINSQKKREGKKPQKSEKRKTKINWSLETGR